MIKFVFRWAFRLLVLAIVLAVAAVLLKDTVARGIAEQRIRRETGFDAKIGKLQFSLFDPVVRLENFVLYNPAEFGGSPIFDIPDLTIEYSPASAPPRLKLLRINVRELHIVENAAGRTNLVDLLNKVAPEALSPRGGTGRGRTFTGIDMLNLSVGKVRYTNLRAPKRNQEIQLGMQNEVVQNIRSEQDLTAILFKILLRAGITVYYGDSKTEAPAPPARPKTRKPQG